MKSVTCSQAADRIDWNQLQVMRLGVHFIVVNMKTQDRKDKVEKVLVQAQELDGIEAIQAWRRLCRELEAMTHPEARMPRFNALLHACWIAASNDQT